MTEFVPILPSAAERIASYSLHSPKARDSIISEAAHRIDIVNFWKILPGSRVLEIGCGAGTATTVLAEAVGPTGHIDAADPGPLDYGAPVTLGEGQEYISKGPLGSRITWHNTDVVPFLTQEPERKWDYVVMAHCIWYFSSLQDLADMFAALKGRADQVLVCEWALKASEPSAVPHVLAAITRASLEAHKADSNANIRCMANPDDIKDRARVSGWEVEDEMTLVPNEGLMDGHWEVYMVKDAQFLQDVEESIENDRVKTMLRSSRLAMLASVETVGANRPRCMDVWVSRFKQGQTD